MGFLGFVCSRYPIDTLAVDSHVLRRISPHYHGDMTAFPFSVRVIISYPRLFPDKMVIVLQPHASFASSIFVS